LISHDSVRKLNEILLSQHQPTVSPARFRPNLVVSCVDDDDGVSYCYHAEDSWKSITVHDTTTTTGRRCCDVVRLHACGLCARCAMVDVDPTTGTKGKTLRALANYRREGGNIHFGIFLQADCNVDDSVQEAEVWLAEGAELTCE